MAEGTEPIHNLVAMGGEALIPGGSHWLKGDVRAGLVHSALGLVATAIWGLPGRAIAAASSYSQATTGKRLYEHVLGQVSKPADSPPPSS